MLVAAAVVAVSAAAAQGSAAHRTFVTRPDLKPPKVSVLTRTNKTAPGYIFIAPKKAVAQQGPLIIDNRGRVVWFKPLNTHAVTNFRVQRYRNRPVLTWWRAHAAEGDETGHYTIADTSYTPIAEVRPGHGLVGDIHEFLITSRNTALLTIYNPIRINGRPIMEGALQEVDIKTGRVLLEWHSIDHVALRESYYRLPKDPGQKFDYFHINSIDVDDDGNLLVSARNTHTVYKLNRRTGKIIWRLGGKRSDFTLGRGVRFAWQHDARRQDDGTITVFDNAASPKTRPQSRGIVLRLDMKRKHATLLRTFVHTPPLVAVDQGNMQKLPHGHYLIGWGHRPFVTEFGPQGRTLLDLRFGPKQGVDSYRAFRFRWEGRPHDRPVVAVRRKTLFVSWNGATEVRAWQLLVGARKQKLRAVRTVPKTAFETAIALPRGPHWIAVRALDERRRPLRRSAIVRHA